MNIDDPNLYNRNMNMLRTKIRKIRTCYYLYIDRDKFTEKCHKSFYDFRKTILY